MAKNNNFDSTLRKCRSEAKKAIRKQDYTDFFVLNKQRKVIEFLLTTEQKLLLDFYLKSLIPNELHDFVTFSIKNEAEENIIHWYFDEELLVLEITVDWGDNKQNISIEIDSEQFEILMLHDNGLNLKVLDYKMLSDFMSNFIKRQAEMISQVFEKIQNENKKISQKETSLNEFMN